MKVYKDDAAKLSEYRQRIADSQKFMDKWEGDARTAIMRYKNLSDIEAWQDEQLGEYRFSIPSGLATIDALYASLTAVQVDITVNNKAHGDVEQARIAEAAIDEVWRDQDVPQKMEYATKDALLTGIGWAKVGYEFVTTETEEERDPTAVEADVAALYDEAEAAGMAPPDPMQVAELVPTTETVERVVRDRVVVDYVPWDMLLWDPHARTPYDIRYHIEILRVPVHEVHENQEYIEYVTTHGGKKSDVTDLKPDRKVRHHALRHELANGLDIADDRITLYRVYDYETGTICTVPEEGKVILLEQPNPFAFHDDLVDRSPFVPLIMRHDPEGVRGVSDMQVIEPLLDELNHYRSMLAGYIAQFQPKLMGPEDALTDEGKEALTSREPGAYIAMGNNHSRNDVGALEPPQLPSEIYDVLLRIVNDIREATGVSELMRGIFPDRKRTATETTEVVAASSARQSEKRNRTERFYAAIARRILWLVMLWYDDERVTRLADLDGDVVWEWSGEDIVMEADLEVVLQPKLVKDHQTRKEDAQFLLGVLGPLEEVDQRELAAFVLDEMGYDRRKTRQLLKLDEEVEADRDMEIQRQADAALAAEGVGPGDEAAASLSVSPSVEDAAALGGSGTAAIGDFLAGP